MAIDTSFNLLERGWRERNRLLDHLAKNAPEARVIQTNNAEENAAMLGINVALGFKPWVAITEWQLRLK